jgi:hypothetical protein
MPTIQYARVVGSCETGATPVELAGSSVGGGFGCTPTGSC